MATPPKDTKAQLAVDSYWTKRNAAKSGKGKMPTGKPPVEPLLKKGLSIKKGLTVPSGKNTPAKTASKTHARTAAQRAALLKMLAAQKKG